MMTHSNPLTLPFLPFPIPIQTQKAWITQGAHAFAVIQQCIKHSEKYKGEKDHNNYLCLSERIFEADLLDTVPFEGKSTVNHF